MKESSNFDSVAFAYDFLARLVFGKSIVASQKQFLNHIPSGARVLIIGGGTGWIINGIFQQSDITKLIYIEASEKMLEMARTKTKKEYSDKVEFIFGTEEAISDLEKVDVIITFFLLDLFTEDEQKIVCDKLLKHLKPQGLWLVSDFDYNINLWWQKILVRIMYVGFRVVSNVRASSLADTQHVLNNLGLKLSEEKFYFRKMIFSRIYHYK